VRAKLLLADEAAEKREVSSEKEQETSASEAALALSSKEEKQIKAVLEKGAKEKAKASVKESEQVPAKSDDVADDYQRTVQAAMEADLKRRAAERKAREAFRSARAKRLASDNYTGKLEASMDKVSDAIMQPDQLVNAARVNKGEGDKVSRGCLQACSGCVAWASLLAGPGLLEFIACNGCRRCQLSRALCTCAVMAAGDGCARDFGP
jgi:hypothetical protein